MKYVYYCQGCNGFECCDEINMMKKCSNCGESLLSLRTDVNTWNGYSNDEMLKVINESIREKEHPQESMIPQQQVVSSNAINHADNNNMDVKMRALTKLMQEGILTPEEFASIVALLSGGNNSVAPVKEKTELEKQYDDIFSKHIVNVFKSPASCKWAELVPEMIKQGTIKINSSEVRCTYIETWIDAPNSYGATLRKKLRLVIDDNGTITRALQELQTSGVTLLGMIANAANKDNWTDIVKW